MRIGILGVGEIGQAIKQVYENARGEYIIYEKDLLYSEFQPGMEYIHVCIPYKDYNQFRSAVRDVAIKYHPEVIVVHSTVVPGTTEKLFEEFGNVAHSPVRGVHPDIYEGLMTFPKFIGAEDDQLGKEIEQHFYELGMESIFVRGSKNTEAAKIWSTTQYGVNIIIEKEIHRYCEENGLNFDVVYGLWNQSYNEGYRRLGRLRYQRYVLHHKPGALGGHCIVQNAELMPAEDMAQIILRKQKGYERGEETKLFKENRNER